MWDIIRGPKILSDEKRDFFQYSPDFAPHKYAIQGRFNFDMSGSNSIIPQSNPKIH